MSGHKRGKYNVTRLTKKDDNVRCVSTNVFKDEVTTIDGVEYLDLQIGGRIPAEFKELYLYVKFGIAPKDWVKCLEDCKLLSKTRVEQAKSARH